MLDKWMYGYAPAAVDRVGAQFELSFPISNGLPIPLDAKLIIRIPGLQPQRPASIIKKVSLSGYERSVLKIRVPAKDYTDALHPEPDLKAIKVGTRADFAAGRARADLTVGFGIDAETYEHNSAAALQRTLRGWGWVDVGGSRGEQVKEEQTNIVKEELAKVLLLQALRSAQRVANEQADAKLRLAQGYLANGRKDQARQVLETLAKDFPNTKAGEQAQKDLQGMAAPATLPAK